MKLDFLCNVHAVSSVCKSAPLPMFPASERDSVLSLAVCAPLELYLLHPLLVLVNIFHMTMSNVQISLASLSILPRSLLGPRFQVVIIAFIPHLKSSSCARDKREGLDVIWFKK